MDGYPTSAMVMVLPVSAPSARWNCPDVASFRGRAFEASSPACGAPTCPRRRAWKQRSEVAWAPQHAPAAPLGNIRSWRRPFGLFHEVRDRNARWGLHD